MKKIYIVTGASSGIGYALCCHLAQRNKAVIAIARNEHGLKKLKKQYPELISTITADLSDKADRENIIKTITRYGEITGLVNNAADNDPISLLENLPLTKWHQQIAINLDAPIFLTQGLLPLITAGGRIINITTGTTSLVVSGVAGYAMTKAALNVFTKYLSEELQPKNILVAAAHPGIAKTGLINKIVEHNDASLGIHQAQLQYQQGNKYLDVKIPAKFLTWLLLDAEDNFYTGDIIGIYNKKYQPLWHDEILPSPYPDNFTPP